MANLQARVGIFYVFDFLLVIHTAYYCAFPNSQCGQVAICAEMLARLLG